MAFTEEQVRAINEEGCNIIVSAGAGSGKTAVLTERVIRKLKQGIDVDKLLVLTFTNEAANEMKSRIRENIIKNKLTRQLDLIDSAYITTFDSFALSLVKKYHYLLNISKDVKIIDSSIITIKKYKILDELFEKKYGTKSFDNLINDFCTKDDINIKEFIINLSNKLDLLIDKESYLDNYLQDNYNDKYINDLLLEYTNLIKKKILELSNLYDSFTSYCSDSLISKLDIWFKPLFENNNVYMVGDIKQSIYRFRNANPYIFQKKYDLYQNNKGGIKIDLIKNFRSREETLININEIFNLIMDNEIGNANYIESHNMKYGNKSYNLEDTKHNNYMDIYNYEMSEDDKYTKEEKELFIISEDIKEKIKNKYQVFDKKTSKLRDLTYSDICIITDRNKHLGTYKKILEYHEIPSVIYMDEELTSDTTILVIKNLINLVLLVNQNIYNDKFRYLFTSVSRSFIFNYDDNQIYHLIKDKTIYKDKIIELCKEIDINEPIQDIINNIINKFDIYNKLTSLSDIEKNIVRISNLIDIASNLSILGYDLEEFINYLDDTIKMGLSVKYSQNTSNGNAVKIMNIHKSKGLEFSLCYFTGMHNKFTIKEINSKNLISDKYGIILPYIKENELQNTILKDLYVNNYYIEEKSEKIRLFYVALTRAREKMIILTNLDDNKESYNHLVPYETRLKYRSFKDILDSIDVIKKYIINKTANYTHDYKKLNIKTIEKSNNNNNKILNKTININYEKVENKQYSKKQNKVIDKSIIKNMEYGTNIHEIFEYADFKNPENNYVINFLKLIDNNFINIYHEYEFTYKINNETYNGIIDLMLEYADHIYIIDYKLKDINDESYIKQLNGYKNYIKTITSKNVQTFLYSILDNKLMEVNNEE